MARPSLSAALLSGNADLVVNNVLMEGRSNALAAN
jgi:hypothetical protein